MRLGRRLSDGLEEFDYVTSLEMTSACTDGQCIESEREGLQRSGGSLFIFFESHDRRCVMKERPSRDNKRSLNEIEILVSIIN